MDVTKIMNQTTREIARNSLLAIGSQFLFGALRGYTTLYVEELLKEEDEQESAEEPQADTDGE